MLRKLYSQIGQDIWVIRDVFDYRRNGIFLDIGAHAGKELSNSYALERYWGWSGLCIEADPTNYAKLKSLRTSQTLNICIAEKRSDVLFQKNKGFYGGIVDDNSLFADENIVKIPALPLSEVLKEHNIPATIDYMSLDVEGAEDRVMAGFPFDTHRFLAATIERPSKALREILRQNGYILVSDQPGLDAFYIHQTLSDSYRIRKIEAAKTRALPLIPRVTHYLKWFKKHGIRSALQRL